jgi:hypothetical protein
MSVLCVAPSNPATDGYSKKSVRACCQNAIHYWERMYRTMLVTRTSWGRTTETTESSQVDNQGRSHIQIWRYPWHVRRICSGPEEWRSGDDVASGDRAATPTCAGSAQTCRYGWASGVGGSRPHRGWCVLSGFVATPGAWIWWTGCCARPCRVRQRVPAWGCESWGTWAVLPGRPVTWRQH